MQPASRLELGSIAENYLEAVESLSREIAAATAAIARNARQALARHVETQQECCLRLCALDGHRARLRAEAPDWPVIETALRTLAERTRVFAALLAYSGRSQRILLSLCHLYRQALGLPALSASGAAPLSCEV